MSMNKSMIIFRIHHQHSYGAHMCGWLDYINAFASSKSTSSASLSSQSTSLKSTPQRYFTTSCTFNTKASSRPACQATHRHPTQATTYHIPDRITGPPRSTFMLSPRLEIARATNTRAARRTFIPLAQSLIPRLLRAQTTITRRTARMPRMPSISATQRFGRKTLHQMPQNQ